MEIINSIYKSYSGLIINEGNYIKLSDLAKLSSDIKAKCVPLDLSTPKNVYFSKNVIFPRNKIQLIDNATRVIKLSKADIAVVDPNIKYHNLWSQYLVYETAKGEKFISTMELSRIQIPGVKQISKESERFVLLNKSDIIDELENLLTEPKNLNEIIDAQSTSVDRYILKVEIEEKVKFIGGKLHIKNQSDVNIAFLIELYFKNNQDEWIKKENTILINKGKIKEESMIEIQKGITPYDISHPNH